MSWTQSGNVIVSGGKNRYKSGKIGLLALYFNWGHHYTHIHTHTSTHTPTNKDTRNYISATYLEISDW